MRRRLAVLIWLALLGWGASAEEAAPQSAQPPDPTGPAVQGEAPSAEPAARLTLVQRVESDPVALIGWTLDQAFHAVGAPREVFAYRGAEAWQDDVVFYYPEGVYLFWYRSRLWQVRADARYTGTFLGLRMGDTRDAVIQALGRPYQDVEGSLVFFLPDASQVVLPEERAKGAYPLRLRVFFRDDRLADAYLYRGDF